MKPLEPLTATIVDLHCPNGPAPSRGPHRARPVSRSSARQETMLAAERRSISRFMIVHTAYVEAASVTTTSAQSLVRECFDVDRWIAYTACHYEEACWMQCCRATIGHYWHQTTANAIATCDKGEVVCHKARRPGELLEALEEGSWKVSRRNARSCLRAHPWQSMLCACAGLCAGCYAITCVVAFKTTTTARGPVSKI